MSRECLSVNYGFDLLSIVQNSKCIVEKLHAFTYDYTSLTRTLKTSSVWYNFVPGQSHTSLYNNNDYFVVLLRIASSV